MPPAGPLTVTWSDTSGGCDLTVTPPVLRSSTPVRGLLFRGMAVSKDVAVVVRGAWFGTNQGY